MTELLTANDCADILMRLNRTGYSFTRYTHAKPTGAILTHGIQTHPTSVKPDQPGPASDSQGIGLAFRSDRVVYLYLLHVEDRLVPQRAVEEIQLPAKGKALALARFIAKEIEFMCKVEAVSGWPDYKPGSVPPEVYSYK